MTKKHLIACSSMLLVLLATRVFISSTPDNRFALMQYNKAPEKKEAPVVKYYSTLSFANEKLPVEDERVKRKIKNVLKTHKYQHLQTNKLHKKAATYFPIIEPILKYYGIPEDFKYVPLVESGLKGGTSPKGASGYWQFMPQTARSYGLRVDSTVDERQMIRKSTIAACKYILSLHREFNNWTLVAAAYNVGEGGLRRQMNRQNEDDYFKMHLNRETASYVYKLISMKEIIENPRMHGYKGTPKRLAKKQDEKPANRYAYFNPVAENTTLLGKQFRKN